MALTGIDKKKNFKKDINYLAKDFDQHKRNLIEYSKVYYPDTYNDFNESSPGMMFMEHVAYLGDVLSFYIDDSIKESLLPYAQERSSIINLAQFFGHKVTPVTPASTRLTVYQLVPSIGSGENIKPDYSYALTIQAGMEVESKTSPSIRFRTETPVDFSFSSSFDPTVSSVYSRDNSTNEPLFYLLKKEVDAFAGTEKTESFSVGSPEEYKTLVIENEKVVEITDIRDSDNRRWYEVPYLAQDYTYVEYPNTDRYDQSLSSYNLTAPFLLRLLKTPRRFVSRLRPDNKTEIQFGAGTSSDPDAILIPSPKDVGLGQNAKSLSSPIDPQNFFKTRQYGQAPSNTTLTVKYIEGGGLSSNVSVNDLTVIRKIEFETLDEDLGSAQVTTINDLKQSVSVTNGVAATGGRDEEPVENIRNDAIAFFAAQNRAVTKRDYEIRALSMPARFGNIAKVFVIPDGNLNLDTTSDNVRFRSDREENNPFAVNMYILGYDSNKKLTTINTAVKENLKTYISEFRMVTDGINMLDGFVVNIGVDFAITVFNSFNKKEVLYSAIEATKDFFDIDKWTFNMPINMSELELEIASVEGVSSVQDISFRNLVGGNYGQFAYDLDSARRVIGTTDNGNKLGKIIYPSLDPMIFEVKYPNRDIRGRVL